jgi:hypothetical protein
VATPPDAEAIVRDLGNQSEDEIAKAIQQLSPEEAAFFLAKLEAVISKRKIQLTGYLVALVVWLITTFLALAYVGTHDGFVGWVFLIPFLLVGAIIYAFGKWSTRVGNNVQGIIDRDAKKAATPAK